MRGPSEWGGADPPGPLSGRQDPQGTCEPKREVSVRGGNLLICLGICRLRMIETTALAGRDPIRENDAAIDMESDLIPTWGRRRESAFVWDRSHHR